VSACIGNSEKTTTDTLYLTVEQVRPAASTCVQVQSLPPAARRDAYEKTAERIAYYQRRNRAARQSHTRTTILRLAQLGVKLLWLPSCVPRDR